MASIYTDVLSADELHYLNNLPEVLAAAASLETRPSGMVYFSVAVTDTIRATLESRFGLQLPVGSSLPMRWIKGDTAPHMDMGASAFENTYLLYLNDSPGELIVDSQSYPIQANTGFVFNEGLRHSTLHTGAVPRLLLGPMNELLEPVGGVPGIYYFSTEAEALDPGNSSVLGYGGNYVYTVGDISGGAFGSGSTGGFTSWRIASSSDGLSSQAPIYANGNNLDPSSNSNPESFAYYYLYPFELPPPILTPGIYYYPTEADALAKTNQLAYGGSNVYTVGDISGGATPPGEGTTGGFTSWRIASSSDGSSSQTVVWQNGNVLNSAGPAHYFLYPSAPCFLEGSTILCQVEGVERYVPVENLKVGTLVKTSLNGYKPVVLIGSGPIRNPGTDARTEYRLYKCSRAKYPQLKEDLYITGGHSILEYPLTATQAAETMKRLGDLFVTDKKYRLMACIDERAEPWNSAGTYTIWNFALEHHSTTMNYGVYANGGLLVESCSINFLRNKSNMAVVA
jgi:hypothetical protein